MIPFHHPPTESTDPTGALTRGWCLPSPEGVYQRLLGFPAVTCRPEPRGADRALTPMEPPLEILLATQGVFHSGKKVPFPIAARRLGVKRRGELLEELALLRCQLLRRDDLDGDDLVAAICASDCR